MFVNDLFGCGISFHKALTQEMHQLNEYAFEVVLSAGLEMSQVIELFLLTQFCKTPFLWSVKLLTRWKIPTLMLYCHVYVGHTYMEIKFLI